MSHHQATVLQISGRLEGSTVDRVGEYARRCTLLGRAVVVDLSGVASASEEFVAVLIAVDEACAQVGVAWVLVPSPAVEAALRAVGFGDLVTVAPSVPAAMRQLAHLARVRRWAVPLGPRTVTG